MSEPVNVLAELIRQRAAEQARKAGGVRADTLAESRDAYVPNEISEAEQFARVMADPTAWTGARQ